MPVTPDKPAPYTSPSPVIELIERHRSRGLPPTIDGEVLARAGVAESLIPRTLQSLAALDLIDEAGNITEYLEGIRKAPEAEYKQRVAEWLNAVYADVLTFADPATDDDTKIRDAFRNYKPYGQQGRMVTLFRQLYAFAGIQGKTEAAAPRPRAVVPRIRGVPPVREQRAKSKLNTGTGGGAGSGSGSSFQGLPPALAGLLQSLPGEAGWTQTQRDKFHNAFGVMLDFCFPIVEAETAPASDGNGG